MELYLRWLAQNEREPDENLPLGIILCAGKNTEQIELLELSTAASTSPNTSRSCRRPRSCARSCIGPLKPRGRALKRKLATEPPRTTRYCKSMPGAVRPFERLRSRLRPARVYGLNTPTKTSVTSAVLSEQWRTPGPTDLIFPKWQRELFKTILDEQNLRFVESHRIALNILLCGSSFPYSPSRY